MDIKDELLTDYSKAGALKVADYIGDIPERFDQLFALFLDRETTIQQRAAMAMSICGERYPHLLYPFLRSMLDNLKNDVHPSVTRCTFQLLQYLDLPEDLWVDIWDIGYQHLVSAKVPVAIKVYAMSVLANLCDHLPELKNELCIIIEDQMPYGSAGFKSRGNKILARLRRRGNPGHHARAF